MSGSVTRHRTERRRTPSERATSSSPTGERATAARTGDDGEREEHDGVGQHQQRAGLVEAPLQEVLGDVGEAQGDDQTGHGQDEHVAAARGPSPGGGGSGPRAARSAARPAWPRRRPRRRSRTVFAVATNSEAGRQGAVPALDDQVDDRPHAARPAPARPGAPRRPARAGGPAERHRADRARQRRRPTRDVRPRPRTESSPARSTAPEEHEDQGERAGGRLVEADLELVVDLGGQRLVAQDLERAELGQHDQPDQDRSRRGWPAGPGPRSPSRRCAPGPRPRLRATSSCAGSAARRLAATGRKTRG